MMNYDLVDLTVSYLYYDFFGVPSCTYLIKKKEMHLNLVGILPASLLI